MKIRKSRHDRSRRGVAMEMAIGYMMVMFALCLLMTTVFYCVLVQNVRSRNQREERIGLDAVGQRFKLYVSNTSYETLNSLNTFNANLLCYDAADRDYFLQDDGFPTAAELNDKYNFAFSKATNSNQYVSFYSLDIMDKSGKLLLHVTIRRNALPAAEVEYSISEWTDRAD